MKKTLTILWIIILAGAAFIAINFFKPQASDIEESTSTTTKTEITETESTETELDANLEIEDTKTYTEHLNTGKLHFDNNQFEAAIKEYKKASELNPNSTSTLIKLGESYLAFNKAKEAEETFLMAEKLNPESLSIKINIAKSLLNQREIEKAKNIIWQLDKSNNAVKYYTALILILYQDNEGAKKLFEEIIKSDPPAEKSLVDNSNKFLEKFKIFNYFTDEDPLYLELLLAESFTQVRQYEASIPLLFKIINEKNNYRDAWLILGYAYLNTGKSQDAIDALSQAKDISPEKPETLFFLGLAYYANKEIDKAITYIEKAEKLGYSDKDQLAITLAELYLLKEKYPESAKKYDEVLEKNPKNIDIYVTVTWLTIEKLNDPQKALKIAEKVLSNLPEDAMSYNLAGWALSSAGDYTNAKIYLEKSIKKDPTLSMAYLNMGKMYEKQNILTLAKEYYKKAYEINGSNSVKNMAAENYNKLTINNPKNYQVNIAR